jgi:hypothetical protein
MHAALLGIFFMAIALAAFAVVSHFVVYVALRRRGVRLSWSLMGLPGYLTRRCTELPSSVPAVRLFKLSRWSDIAFGVAFLGVLLSLPLFGARG